jgi:hypothetical protein
MTAGSARRPRLLLLGGLVVVVVAIVAAIVGLQPRPAPADAAAPPVAALIVSISHTGDPIVSAGFPTTLTVRALGDQPIGSVELWLGARLLAEASNAGGGPAQVARWTWTPGTTGPAVLVARATDARGREAQSAPLRISVVTEPPKFRPVRPVIVREGENAAAAAVRIGGEFADLARWNEGLDPLAPLETGTVVYVPLPVRDVPRPDTTDEIEAAIGLRILAADSVPAGPGTVSLASWTGAGPSVTLGPTLAGTGLFVPPEVVATVEDCTIKVAVSGHAANATGMALSGLAPDATTFARVSTFAGGAGVTDSFTTTASAGAYLFSASSYDGAVEEQGDLVSVEVPPDCGDPGWSGDATLANGRLVVGGSVDRAYLYLSQDDGPWRRVPEEPNVFVDRIDGQLDFGPYLPANLASTTVDIEAWGWGEAGLLPLGTGHHEPQPTPGTPLPGPVTGGAGGDLFAGGTFTSLDWIVNHGTGTGGDVKIDELLAREGELVAWTSVGTVTTPLDEDFRWQTNATGVDSLVWQVAAFPMSPDIAPDHPGVLLQKVEHFDTITQQGEFPIDFRPIFAPSVGTANVGDVLNGGLIQQLTLPEFKVLASGAPSPLGSPMQATGTEAYSPSWLLSSFTPSVLYVRAIPMAGAKVAAKVSNFVKLIPVSKGDFGNFDTSATYPPGPQPTPAGPSGLKPYTLVLQFLPPQNANPAFAECVLVTGILPEAKPGVPVSLGGVGDLQEGDFFCLFTGSKGGWTLAGSFEDFVDAVADAWDAVSEAWSWLQSQLASFVATISGCKELADSDFCDGLAKVAISVALTAVGIPPSLPNTKDLINLGKGELKGVLLDAATALIGEDPCTAAYLASKGLGTATCDDIADAFIDELVSKLDALKTQEATATTGVQVPYGVNVVQHPWGTLRPPRFRVTIARNTAVPLPTVGECRMTLSMASYVSSWTHSSWNAQTKAWGTTTDNVAGEPFVRLTLSVPDPSKAEGPVVLPSAVPKDASIYEKLLAALNQKVLINRDYYLTETNFWREPNNPDKIYTPGKGYTYFVDHANRAWVLLQNGAGIIAKITVPTYAANCFDPVVAFGVIPLVNQGYPCTPSWGWWWDTIKAPFNGTIPQQLKCNQDYKEAVGY